MPPFVRVSRDRRGYEHTYLFQVRATGGRSGRPRLVYWFRTPPGVRIGRPAFDPAMRESIQAQFPEQEFDWEKFEAIPPPPEVENWRERRRIEKAAKRARAAEAAEPGADEVPEQDDPADLQGDGGEVGIAEARSVRATRGEQAGLLDGPIGEPDAGSPGTSAAGRRRGRRRGRGRAREGGPRAGEAAAPVVALDASSMVAPAAEGTPPAGGAPLEAATEPDSGS